jgi:regulator of RNase E activity RraA
LQKVYLLSVLGRNAERGEIICVSVDEISEIDVPVKLNLADHEIRVNPGDIIIGDADGVVCLPKSLADRVLEMVPGLISGPSFPS